MKKLVGTVAHYFGHLGVAVVELKDALRNGDKIEIDNAEGKPVLAQTVYSMQIEKDKVAEAKPGQAIGLKVEGKVHPGNLVYTVTA